MLLYFVAQEAKETTAICDQFDGGVGPPDSRCCLPERPVVEEKAVSSGDEAAFCSDPDQRNTDKGRRQQRGKKRTCEKPFIS